MVSLTQFVLRALEKLARRSHSRQASHLALGRHGETEAYFYLKRLGYRFVATNFRVPGTRGEIDLIGWDQHVLCFVEVKTRSDDSFAPPSSAVTASKKQHIISVARRYLRRLPGDRPTCRFDILGIVVATSGVPPKFTLHKGAFSWDDGSRRHSYRDFSDWRLRRDTGPR